MIFAQFDHKKYLLERKIYSYEKNLPAYKVNNWSELIDKINLILNHEDIYKKQRSLMMKKIYKYRDGNSSFRLFEFISGLD